MVKDNAAYAKIWIYWLKFAIIGFLFWRNNGHGLANIIEWINNPIMEQINSIRLSWFLIKKTKRMEKDRQRKIKNLATSALL